MKLFGIPAILVCALVLPPANGADAPAPGPIIKATHPDDTLPLRPIKVTAAHVTSRVSAIGAGPALSTRRMLTLKEAHELALKKHPKITTARLLALAAWQSVDEARSGYYPSVALNVAGVDTARENTRSVSQSLQVSTVVERGGAAVFISQLLTDFGRTSNLVASTNLKAKSQEKNVDATKAQILLEVDNAYFATLRNQTLLRVAQGTVAERRVIAEQVKALAQNELRSSLDVSFADVSLQQAELLLSRTENDLASSYATLAALLDESNVTEYQLTDEFSSGKPSTDVFELIATAFRNRPDLLSLGLQHESAVKFSKAERALNYPRITAEAIGGELPYHDATTNQDYGAAGVEVNWPIFNGKLFSAKTKEAELRAQASDETLHDARNDVERDVRIAWFSANNAYKNMAITSKLRQQTKRSLDLATARYNAGTSSMVELSQAQLALTSAEIDETSARYEYLLRLSILSYQTGNLK
jgi:outer membrane protein